MLEKKEIIVQKVQQKFKLVELEVPTKNKNKNFPCTDLYLRLSIRIKGFFLSQFQSNLNFISMFK